MNREFWTGKIHLKNLSFPRFMVAPLDGVTDSPTRRLIRKFSPDVLGFTEMRHVSCVANEKTGRSVRYDPIEQPLAFQVSANKTEFMETAVRKILEHNFVMLNLNIGCPAKNVIKSGSGSALMANPKQLKIILLELKKQVNGAIPFTLKMRAGFKETSAYEIAQLAQDCGVEMISIHPRKQQGAFSAPLDYDLVAKIKQKLSIPIVFSGNVFSFANAKKVYERTGVDGFMIGRALWGAPWRIKEMTSHLTGEEFHISQHEMILCALKHLDLNVEFYGPKGAIMFKKQLPQYIRGVPDAAAIRHKLVRLPSYDEIKQGLENLRDG